MDNIAATNNKTGKALYIKRKRDEYDAAGGREERLVRDAAYRKEYRARKKEENINTRQQNSDTSSATTPSCNDIDTS
jgi:hypothetical protein